MRTRVLGMPVTMVDIRVMYVGVRQRRMTVGMRMRLAAIPREIVGVLVMIIVHMAMRVQQLFVRMLVFVTFRQVQPNAGAHQQ